MAAIYLIADPTTRRTKIGRTERDPQECLAELQTGASSRLTLVHAHQVQDARTLEKALHHWFSDAHVTGGWFSLTSMVISTIIDQFERYY